MSNRNLAVALATLSLSACGGGGGGGESTPIDPLPPSGLPLLSPEQTGNDVVASHQLDSTNIEITASEGILDRASNRVSIAGLQGTIDAARERVALDGGGSIELTQASTLYVAMFDAEPSSGNPLFGVVGIPTQISELPVTAGTASYLGVGMTNVQIIDGQVIYDLTGDVDAVVDFVASNVDISFANLDGLSTDGLSDAVMVEDIATLSLTGAVLNGNVFSGGNVELESDQLDGSLSGNEIVASSGGLFGPSTNNEIGGVFLVDDTHEDGTILIQGIYVADQLVRLE